MKAFFKMTWIELKLFLREPVGAFFTLVFPLLLLLIFGSIYGNEPVASFGGFGSVDLSTPGYIGLIIGTIGMISLPVTLANYRQSGVLRRLRATPVDSGTILWAQVVMNVITAFVGTAALVTVGRVAYGLLFPSAGLAVVLAILLSGLSFFAVGFVLAGVMPSPRTAQAVGMALFYPMLFLSGAAVPRQIMPETLQRIAEFLPLTHVVVLLEDLWLRGVWNTTSLLVVSGMLLACLLLARRTFRWE